MEMENRAKIILEKHGCEFIQMTTETYVLWKNRNNIIREDDIAVLSNMSENAWKFWELNTYNEGKFKND